MNIFIVNCSFENRVDKINFLPISIFLATSVTWTAPPPAWTQTNPSDFRTVNMSVLNGSTQLALRWNYTLPAGVLISTTFSIRLNDGSFDDIAMISGGNTVVFNKSDYTTRFNISKSEVATLIKSLKEKKRITNASLQRFQTHGVTEYVSL